MSIDDNATSGGTAGVCGVAGSMPGVQDLSVVVRAGVERAGVVAWEQRNNVSLPQPLKSFYSASDGFKLTWNYATAGYTYSHDAPKSYNTLECLRNK